MSLSITFSETPTVSTGSNWTCSAATYADGLGLWVLLGFRTAHADVLQTSPDTTTWTMQTLPSTNTYRAMAYAPTLGGSGRLVIVGNGVAAWSDDGVTWAAATLLPETNNWCDVVWWAAKNQFVAVASSGVHRVMTSADGKTWVSQTAAAAKSWQGVAVSDTGAVSVAFSSVTNTQLVQTSTDGVTWVLVTHTAIATNRGLVGGGAARLGIGYSPRLNQFLITGTDATNFTKAWRSTDDGATWTASNTIPTISNTTNRGYLWLPRADTWYLPCANFNYGESTDGVTWTVTALSTTHSGFTPVAWSESRKTILGGSTLGFDSALIGLADLPDPSVTAVIPNTGPAAGGQAVTVRGYGFTVAMGVRFGGAAVTTWSITSNTEIRATTPAHASGAVDVEVLGVATGTALYTYSIALTLLPPIPIRTPLIEGSPTTITRPWTQWLQAVKTRVETPVSIVPEQIGGGGALSAVSDTNVTLTLTGSPTTALLAPVTATLGWAGRLGVTRGGTGLGSVTAGDLLYAAANQRLAQLAIGTAGKFLRSTGTLPAWSTLVLPNSAATGDLLYATGANTLGNRTIGSSGDVLTVSGGVPVWSATSAISVPYTSISSVPTATVLGRNTAGTGAAEALGTLPTAVQDTITRLGTLTNGPGGFTGGSVVFHNGTTLAQDNANLFWDDSNNRLGVNTAAAPSHALHVSYATTNVATVRFVAARTADDLGTVAVFDVERDGAAGGNGLGGQFLFRGETSTTLAQNMGAFGFDWIDATHASRSAEFVLKTVDSAVEQRSFGVSPKGNVLIGDPGIPTGSNGIVAKLGTALSGLPSQSAGLYPADDGTGNIRFYGINEDGQTGPLGIVVIKGTTGDPTGYEGLFEINTFDNTFKVYADGAWRTLASGW